MTGWGGKRDGAGRKRTAYLRLIHLSSCIEDWAAEEGNRRGAVKRALLEAKRKGIKLERYKRRAAH